MLARVRFWLATLLGAAAAVGSSGSAIARAGTVVTGRSQPSTLHDDNRFVPRIASTDPLLSDSLLQNRSVPSDSGDGSLFARTARTEQGFERPVTLDLLGQRGDDIIKIDIQPFPDDVTGSFVSSDVSGFDLARDRDSALHRPDEGKGNAQLRTTPPTQVTPARPLAIPLPPGVALFPLGAAAALWAHRRLRRRAKA